MTHPNNDLLQRYYEAFQRGDLDTMAACFHHDVAFHEPGRHPLSGTHEGPSAVIDLFKALVERTGGTLRLDQIGALVANADTGAAKIHLTARSAEGPVAIEALELYTFRDGLISDIRAYLHDQYEWDALLS